MIDVDAKDLPTKFVNVLGEVVWIVAIVAIAGAYIQVAVGTESKHPPMVLNGKLRNREYDGFCRVGDVSVIRNAILRDHQHAVRLPSVAYKESPIGFYMRIEDQAQQSSLDIGRYLLCNVEKQGWRC